MNGEGLQGGPIGYTYTGTLNSAEASNPSEPTFSVTGPTGSERVLVLSLSEGTCNDKFGVPVVAMTANLTPLSCTPTGYFQLILANSPTP